MGKEVNDDDVFHFNAEFTDPRHQVHINSIQVKETVRIRKLTLLCVCSHLFVSPLLLGVTCRDARRRRTGGHRRPSRATGSMRWMRPLCV